jgi:hypothetical protein
MFQYKSIGNRNTILNNNYYLGLQHKQIIYYSGQINVLQTLTHFLMIVANVKFCVGTEESSTIFGFGHFRMCELLRVLQDICPTLVNKLEIIILLAATIYPPSDAGTDSTHHSY